MSDPFTTPLAWDSITIGGLPTPGRCEVTDGKRENDFDVKKGKGASGATTTYTGNSPATFKVKFFLWETEHFLAWDGLRPLLVYAPEKGIPVMAMNIYHPSLAHLEIGASVVKSMSVIKKEDDKGTYSFEIEFLEYKPPLPVSAVSTPKQAGDASSPDVVGADPQLATLQSQLATALAGAQAAYK